MDVITIPSRNGKRNYRIILGSSYDMIQEFHVTARNHIMALDIVGDYCEKNKLRNLYATKKELEPLCAKGQSVDELAEANGLTKCGVNEVYIIGYQINEL